MKIVNELVNISIFVLQELKELIDKKTMEIMLSEVQLFYKLHYFYYYF